MQGISGRACAKKLGISEAQLRKDRRHGCPTFPDESYDVDAVRRWRETNRGTSRNRSGTAATQVRTAELGTQPDGSHQQPSSDDCGLREPHPLLAADDGEGFYRSAYADADLVALAELLQARVPELAGLDGARRRAVRRAIRETVCEWSAGAACPHCRRSAGIVDPPEPPEMLDASAA